MIYLKEKINKEKGFTIVETMVAIGILSLSILATFTAVQTSLQFSTNVKDQIVAFYLIQDGMEYVKNVRDKNALSSVSGISTDWLDGLSENPGDNCYFGKVCIIDSYAGTTGPGGGVFGTSQKLRQNAATGLYSYNLADPLTRFRREIQITRVKDDEIKVNISVDWDQRGVNKSFQVSELIFKRQ